MKTLVTITARFYKGPDGRIYPHTPWLTYDFFVRYLDVFEEVLILARVGYMDGRPLNIKASDGPGISFAPVPLYSSTRSFLRSILKVRSIIRRVIDECQAFILRVPDPLGTLAWKEIRHRGFPFALEIVGDPAGAMKTAAAYHPLRGLLRYMSVKYLRKQCAEAKASAYVTNHILQNLYPPSDDAFTTNCSDIDLPISSFAAKPRGYLRPATRLVYVGTLEILYKGQDVLVEALAILATRGLKIHLTLVGDGKMRGHLTSLIEKRGLEHQVSFLGKVAAGSQVIAALDEADIFVLPSLTEGLPKALIEAMARGLPCIGSNVGGIPELLAPEDIVQPSDPLSLANKIEEVALNPSRMAEMAARNLAVAQDYRGDLLRNRRRDFYQRVLQISEEHLAG